MPEPITLSEAKAHLRITYSDEDSYIETLITAARQYAENYQNRVYVERENSDGSVVEAEDMPAMEKAACLLLIGHLFENRIAVGVKDAALEVPLGVTAILNLRRNLPV